MAEETSDESSSSVVKNIQNYHHIKIGVVKFDDTNNFGLSRCEVLDALMRKTWRMFSNCKRPEEMEEESQKSHLFGDLKPIRIAIDFGRTICQNRVHISRN